ncbi:class I SAM-dependent methyltransferase [Gammaproteobacteria bacterium]|nr:class I SAM-dependent methyltransferase [Gammaproteobacteria bacterium]
MKPEEKASNFYNSNGWEHDKEGNTLDANKWEDLRVVSKEYIVNCRKRLNRFIPKNGELFFDLGSGPIQYPEYLEYSKNFKERHCMDLSKSALEVAAKKATNIKTFHGSFFDVPMSHNIYDCSISQHVIYHMDKDDQAIAINKMIDITKSGGKIVIVYGNPNSILEIPYKINRLIKKIFNLKTEHDLYHFVHPLKWWYQFNEKSKVEMYPWRTFNVFYLKKLFPNNFIGKFLLKIVFKLENMLPKFITLAFAQYPTIVLTKK